MATLIQDGLEFDITVTGGLDAEGNTVEVDAASPVTGRTSDENIATVGPGPSNQSVTVKTTGPGLPIGPFTITITGDGDAGEGVKAIDVAHDFVSHAGPAETLTTEISEPRPRT